MKPRLTIILLVGVLTAWLFGPALVGRSSFAYRDAAHYYHPLFEYIRDQWSAGRVPLWNPYENLGGPLVAENTSSVFYPGKLLFALPLDYTWLFNVYIVSHVVLAAATSYLLARRFEASPLAAGLAALSYAFCGDVLLQYCNLIFLVGASWLPLALLFADRMLRERAPAAAAGLGVVLALMALGGDPQMAYNAVLLVAFYAILLWRQDRRVVKSHDMDSRPALVRRRAVLIGLSLLVAAGLAAIQVLPTLEAGPHSERSRYDAPRNVYELAAELMRGRGSQRFSWYEGLLDSGHHGHHGVVYRYSLQPTNLPELFWPGFSGQLFPTDTRWLRAFDLEGYLWMPSVYMGLAPVVLALLTWSVRRRASVAVRFWSWTALLAALASLGVYGGGWLLRQLLGEPVPGVGDETGGLYWWMVVLLPSYVQFRYPAKLFVVASLALSVLAARGWDRFWQTPSRRVYLALAVVLLASLAMLVVLAACWSGIEQGEIDASEKWLGPFDWQGAWNSVVDSLLHAALLAAVLATCFWIGRRSARDARLMQVAVLIITVVDLGVAHERLIEYAPASDWALRPAVVDVLAGKLGSSRVVRQLGVAPQSWQYASSPERYVQWLRWDRETLWPKYPLPYEIRLADTAQTVAGDDYRTLIAVARTQSRREHGGALPHPSVLNLVAARFAIVNRAAREEVVGPRQIAEDMFLGSRPQALERAWIVHHADAMQPPVGRGPTQLKAWFLELLFPDNKPRDWRHTAVVESDAPLIATLRQPPDAARESCRIVRDDPQRVEIEATLAAPGLVVLSDQFYPGWKLSVATGGGEPRDAPILCTNGAMRGALLPPGRHRLTYRYRPASIACGAAISGLSVGGLVLASGILLWRRKRGGAWRHYPAEPMPPSR